MQLQRAMTARQVNLAALRREWLSQEARPERFNDLSLLLQKRFDTEARQFGQRVLQAGYPQPCEWTPPQVTLEIAPGWRVELAPDPGGTYNLHRFKSDENAWHPVRQTDPEWQRLMATHVAAIQTLKDDAQRLLTMRAALETIRRAAADLQTDLLHILDCLRAGPTGADKTAAREELERFRRDHQEDLPREALAWIDDALRASHPAAHPLKHPPTALAESPTAPARPKLVLQSHLPPVPRSPVPTPQPHCVLPPSSDPLEERLQALLRSAQTKEDMVRIERWLEQNRPLRERFGPWVEARRAALDAEANDFQEQMRQVESEFFRRLDQASSSAAAHETVTWLDSQGLQSRNPEFHGNLQRVGQQKQRLLEIAQRLVEIRDSSVKLLDEARSIEQVAQVEKSLDESSTVLEHNMALAANLRDRARIRRNTIEKRAQLTQMIQGRLEAAHQLTDLDEIDALIRANDALWKRAPEVADQLRQALAARQQALTSLPPKAAVPPPPPSPDKAPRWKRLPNWFP